MPTNYSRLAHRSQKERNRLLILDVDTFLTALYLIAAEAKGLYKTDRKAAREAPRDPAELQNLIADLQAEMLEAAEELKFEYAAKLRDEIKDLERQLQELVS